jgi:hypothetical protein
MSEPRRLRRKLSWRHAVMVALIVAGVGVFLLLFRQPARQGFSADLQLVSSLQATPGSLHLQGLTPAVDQVYERARRFVLTGADSLWADNPHGSLPYQHAIRNAHASIVSRATPELSLSGWPESEPVSLTILPDRERSGRMVSVDFHAGSGLVSVGFWAVGAPSEQTRGVSLGLTRVQMTSALNGSRLIERDRQDVSVEDTTGCRSVLQVESDACVDTAAATAPSFVPLSDVDSRIAVLGGWTLESEGAGLDDLVELRGRFGPADTIELTSLDALDSAYVDAAVCTLQVYSGSRRDPVVVCAPIRLRVTGVFNFVGLATASGLRVVLNGVASSVTYQYLTGGTPIGDVVQCLPSKLEEFSGQTVAFAAMLFAFLTLLRFIWDIFMKKDQGG